MKPLTLSEFRDALRKGKGRAYLHVCQYGDVKVRKALLEACRRDLRYDTQIEEEREEWLHTIFAASDHVEQYLKSILRALLKCEDIRQTAYLLALTGQFARRGNEKARQAIRTRFMQRDLKDEDAWAEPMMNAYGMEGFLDAADAIGEKGSKADKWFADWFFDLANKRFGEEKVKTALLERSKLSSGIRRFLHALRRAERAKGRHKPTTPTLRQVLKHIETGRSRSPINRYGFSRRANGRDIQFLFNRMLKETRPGVVYRYLQVFCNRELPRLDPRIFEWARTGNEDVHRVAMLALSSVKHETVREFALERLLRKDGARDWWGLDLLAQNWAKGDGRWIRPLLPQDGEAFFLHGIGRSLIEISDMHRDQTLGACLLWAYEQTPCSRCRWSIVNSLIRLRRAPQRLLREAVHDADGNTRRRAARALSMRAREETARRTTVQM